MPANVVSRLSPQPATPAIDYADLAAALQARIVSTIPVPIGEGGTDSATEGDARQALGLEIGVDVQAFAVALAALGALAPAADRLAYFDGASSAALATLTGFARTLLDDASDADARTTLGLVIGTNVQAQSANLQAIAGLTSAADRLAYFTGSGTAALAAITTFGRALLDDASAADALGTLKLKAGTATVANGADHVEVNVPNMNGKPAVATLGEVDGTLYLVSAVWQGADVLRLSLSGSTTGDRDVHWFVVGA